jgi:hypothetical protein
MQFQQDPELCGNKLGEFVANRAALTRRSTIGGSIASLLSLTGQPIREAGAQFINAAGGKAGTDLLILDPSSPQFAGLTQGFNRRWSAPQCNLILLPLTEAGAVQALDRAIESGPGKFRIRGGGHCYEDFVFNADTQTLTDVSLLNEIGFDAQNGVYYAQSGATTWDLYRELYWRFGLTLPASSCHSVGLGGHVCGGGYGLPSASVRADRRLADGRARRDRGPKSKASVEAAARLWRKQHQPPTT